MHMALGKYLEPKQTASAAGSRDVKNSFVLLDYCKTFNMFGKSLTVNPVL